MTEREPCKKCLGRGMVPVPGTWFLGGPLFDLCDCQPRPDYRMGLESSNGEIERESKK